MEHPNEEFLKNWFDRIWNRNDPIERVGEAFDQYWCTEAQVSGMAGEVMNTKDQLLGFIQLFRNAFEQIDIQPHTFYHNDPWTHFKMRGSMVHLDSSTRVTFDGFCEARVENGKIKEGSNYIDFLPILEQIGALPSDSLAAAFQGQRLVVQK